MRWSRPIPRATSRTSAPTCSHTLAISLTNEIFVARNAFEAYLIISAVGTEVRTTSASMPRYSASTASPSWGRKEPTTMRSGSRKSWIAAPSRRNSGFEAYVTWVAPRPASRP